MLDDFVALIERLLDERIARQCPDHIKPRDRSFVAGRQLRQSVRLGGDVAYADRFDELPRGDGAEARDYPMTYMRDLARARLDYHATGGALAGTRLHILHAQYGSAVFATQDVAFDRLADPQRIAVFGARKPVSSIDDNDLIVTAQGHRVFDRRIPCAD